MKKLMLCTLFLLLASGCQSKETTWLCTYEQEDHILQASITEKEDAILTKQASVQLHLANYFGFTYESLTEEQKQALITLYQNNLEVPEGVSVASKLDETYLTIDFTLDPSVSDTSFLKDYDLEWISSSQPSSWKEQASTYHFVCTEQK